MVQKRLLAKILVLNRFFQAAKYDHKILLTVLFIGRPSQPKRWHQN